MDNLLEKRLIERGFSEVEYLMILSVIRDLCPVVSGKFSDVCWTKKEG